MVVCNASFVQAPALHPYTAGVCPVSPIPGLPCQQRVPLLPGTPIVALQSSMPCGQGLSSSTMLQYSGNLNGGSISLPATVGTAVVPAIPTSLVPYTASTVHNTIVPYEGEKANPSTTCTQVVTTTSQVLPSQVFTVHNNQQLLGSVPCSPGSDVPSPPAVLSGTTSAGLLPSSPVCQISSNILNVQSWKQSYGMEQLWQWEFQKLFSQYTPHMWLLLPVNQKPGGVWNSNVDSAKVRFCCEDCGHGWTSMKGRVGFWFILNPTSGEGVVCLKLYGQQCDRCKTGTYEPAMWYPEEVLKVLVNIYNRVGQVYYGFQQAPYHRSRRPGKPRTPHNSELCQACKDGVCSERR